MAWNACESPADTPEQLEPQGALDSLLKLPDARLKYDKSTESPQVFEEYFSSQTDDRENPWLTTISGFTPTRDETRGWLLLRRARLVEEQKTLIMRQLGMTLLMFERMAAVVQST